MTKITTLSRLGWDNFFEKEFEKISVADLLPGRVLRVNKSNYLIQTSTGEFSAEVSGKFHFNADGPSDFPAVGDWIAMQIIEDEKKGIIEHLIVRKNSFSRKVAGAKTDEQVIASNIDYVFIISSLNQDINLRRIERYVTLSRECKLNPVIILSKSDQCDAIEEIVREVSSVCGNIAVHAISALKDIGIEELQKYFEGNKTVAVVGSSGVGKSTLINRLMNSDSMEVRETSSYKDKGRHTTSHRELLILPEGGMIIDTPGMRELQLWEGSEGVSETFADIEKYLGQCKFSDCKHESEPGCAIRKAMDAGELDEDRYRSYQKLQREINWFENRKDKKAMMEQKKKWKKITAAVRNKNKF